MATPNAKISELEFWLIDLQDLDVPVVQRELDRLVTLANTSDSSVVRRYSLINLKRLQIPDHLIDQILPRLQDTCENVQIAAIAILWQYSKTQTAAEHSILRLLDGASQSHVLNLLSAIRENGMFSEKINTNIVKLMYQTDAGSNSERLIHILYTLKKCGGYDHIIKEHVSRLTQIPDETLVKYLYSKISSD